MEFQWRVFWFRLVYLVLFTGTCFLAGFGLFHYHALYGCLLLVFGVQTGVLTGKLFIQSMMSDSLWD